MPLNHYPLISSLIKYTYFKPNCIIYVYNSLGFLNYGGHYTKSISRTKNS